MKLLSVLIAAVFLISTTSIAQARYAFQNPSEMPSLLTSIALAVSIYLLFSNLGKIRTIKLDKFLSIINYKKGYSNRVFRIS